MTPRQFVIDDLLMTFTTSTLWLRPYPSPSVAT